MSKLAIYLVAFICTLSFPLFASQYQDAEVEPLDMLAEFLQRSDHLWDQDHYNEDYVRAVKSQLREAESIKKETDEVRKLLSDASVLKAKIAINPLNGLTLNTIDSMKASDEHEKISHVVAYFDECIRLQSKLMALGLEIDARRYCFMTGIELDKLSKFLVELKETTDRKKELVILREEHKNLLTSLGGASSMRSFETKKLRSSPLLKIDKKTSWFKSGK